MIPPVQDNPEELQVSAANLTDNHTAEDLRQVQLLDGSIGGILQAKETDKKPSAEFA